jgi:hypothetical protein
VNVQVTVALGGIACAALSALIAYVVAYRVSRRYVRRVLAGMESSDEQEAPMTEDKPKRHLPSMSTIIIMVLSAILMVMAVQVYLSNMTEDHANADRDEAISCLFDYKSQNEKWAADVLDTLDQRGSATAGVRDRDKSWHKRVDAIFQLLISSRAGQEFTDAEIDQIASDYQRASLRLFHAYDVAEQTAAENPYPTLALSCKEQK